MKNVRDIIDYDDSYVLFAQAQDDNFINKQIKWWNKALGEPKTKVGHVGMIICSTLIEQTWPEQIASPIDKYKNPIIYRRKNLSENDEVKLSQSAVGDLGKRYGVLNIVKFLISAVFWKVVTLPFYMIHCFLDLFRKQRKPWKGLELSLLQFMLPCKNIVCSQTVAKYYWDIGIHIGGHWLSATPDRMLDHMENHEEWELIE